MERVLRRFGLLVGVSFGDGETEVEGWSWGVMAVMCCGGGRGGAVAFQPHRNPSTPATKPLPPNPKTPLPPMVVHPHRNPPTPTTKTPSISFPSTFIIVSGVPLSPSSPLLPVGISPLSGYLLQPPHSATAPLIVPPRPPPEPPPPENVVVFESPSSPRTLLHMRSAMACLVSVSLVPLWPPRKPPWKLNVFHAFLVSVTTPGASMGSVQCSLYFRNFWFKDAYMVFAESLHRTLGCLSIWLWSLMHYMVTIKTCGADTYSDTLA